MRLGGKAGIMMAMVGIMAASGGGGMYGEPTMPRRRLPDVPKSSTEPNPELLFNLIYEHNKAFKGKEVFTVNEFPIRGINLKHANKKIKEFLAECNLVQTLTAPEWEKMNTDSFFDSLFDSVEV